jgi:predicted MFS family arabinose efflux permease
VTTLDTAAPETGLQRYALLLRAPDVRPVVLAGLFARVPLGMFTLAAVLILRDTGRSYAVAGAIIAANTIAAAISVPILGRFIDRLGQRAILVPFGILYGATQALFVVLARAGASSLALGICGVAIGLTIPPLGACMRALWADLAPSEDLRETAYALEATLQEIFFVLGPLLTAVLAALISPDAALIVAAVCALFGTLALAATPASRRWRGDTAEHVGRLGALGARGVRTVLLACAGMGAAFGAIEVAMPAFCESHGSRAAAGIPLAAFSLGSLLGGLWAGTRHRLPPPARRYVLAMVAFAIAMAGPLLAGSIPAMTLLILLAGAPIAPAFATAYALVNQLAIRGTHTEAFAWISTAIMAGVSVGTALGGDLIHRRGVTEALALGTGFGGLALLSVVLRRRSLLAP